MVVAVEVRAPEVSRSLPFIALIPLLWVKAWSYRLWWHIQAYTSIFAIMIFVLVSLVGLHLHRLIEIRQLSLQERNKKAVA